MATNIRVTAAKKVGTIKISGVPIRVDLATDITIDDGEEKSCYCLGAANLSLTQVFVRRGLSNELRESVLLHELIHIIDHIHNIDLSEEQVNTLGNALYEMGENNPGWWEIVHD